jgi:hypothetical protein
MAPARLSTSLDMTVKHQYRLFQSLNLLIDDVAYRGRLRGVEMEYV